MIEYQITDEGLFDFVLHRLAKETKLYGTETTALEVKRDKFIADGAEEWDIKNAVSCSQKTISVIRKFMLTHTHKKL